MHRIITVLVAMLLIVVAAPSRADVGPPPSCPPGTHHAYMYGHRCVPDGSHLEHDPNGGGVLIVKDGEVAPKPSVIIPKPPPRFAPDDPLDPFPTTLPTVANVAPPASASAAPAPVASASAAPAPVASASAAPAPAASASETTANPAASSPPQKGCTCGVPGAPEERIGFVVVIGAMLFAMSRRIRRDRSKH